MWLKNKVIDLETFWRANKIKNPFYGYLGTLEFLLILISYLRIKGFEFSIIISTLCYDLKLVVNE